eukprot:5335009-Amphidinium_carterae.1
MVATLGRKLGHLFLFRTACESDLSVICAGLEPFRLKVVVAQETDCNILRPTMTLGIESRTITVASLSGATACLQCDSSDTHCDISKKAATDLNLIAPYGLHLLCAGRALSEHVPVSKLFEADVANEVQVLVKSVLEWLADHEFIYHYKTEQDARCGQPYFVSNHEIDGGVRFFRDGTFEFEWVELIRVEDTAQSRSCHQRTIATGLWRLSLDNQSVALVGRAEEVTNHSEDDAADGAVFVRSLDKEGPPRAAPPPKASTQLQSLYCDVPPETGFSVLYKSVHQPVASEAC